MANPDILPVNAGTAAIFDLDGTLLDSMGVWGEVDERFLAKRGISMPDDYQSTVSSMQFRQIAEYTIDRFSLDDTVEGLLAEWSAMARDMYANDVQPKTHALDYLAWLRASGAKLAVATTLTPQLRDPALHHLGLDVFFDTIVSVDDAGGVGKQEPDVYLLAAEGLGVPPTSCTVFEDLYEGMASAKRAGMHVWAMFDDSSRAQWERICETADGTIADFSQAPRRLQR